MERILAFSLALSLAASIAIPFSASNVSAHNCNSGEAGGCGPCPEGEDHSHNDPENQCSSRGSFIPGFTAPLTVAALGAALLVASRTRD